MDFKQIEKDVVELVRKPGQFIADQLGRVSAHEIEEKELNSLVSFVDKNAEIQIVEGLSKILPEASFITEENTVEQKISSINWIIDPLDGTNNFLHEIPHFAISIALRVDQQLKVGVILDIMRDEVFHATAGQGAYLNGGKPIKVSQTTSLEACLIGTGFPYTNKYDMETHIKILGHWLNNSRGIRRFGAAALDLAYVASGRFDCFYESNLNVWDVAAGIVLVREAGGEICDFSGGNDYYDGKQIIASNPNIHSEVLKVIREYFRMSVYQS